MRVIDLAKPEQKLSQGMSIIALTSLWTRCAFSQVYVGIDVEDQ
jgi:hypothetical protein